MLPLTFTRPGERVTVRRVSGSDEARRHLAELGFVAETPVTVVNQVSGNLIVQVRDSRVALDRAMANRIFIEG